jgi:hypothetical protein
MWGFKKTFYKTNFWLLLKKKQQALIAKINTHQHF